MNKIQVILQTIELIEKKLRGLKEQVGALDKPKKTKTHGPRFPDDSELKTEYEALYRGFLECKTDVVAEFVSSHNRAYLTAFYRANSLPIDLKRVSKEAATEQMRNWLSQRKAVTAPVIEKTRGTKIESE